MGTWDPTPFGNDAALDWLSELEFKTDDKLVKETLARQEGVSENDEEIVAAAALVLSAARLDLRKCPNKETKEWISKTGYIPDEMTIKTAIVALIRIKQNSDLRDSWSEAPQFNTWLTSVNELIEKLEGIDELPNAREPKARLPRVIHKLCALPDILTNEDARAALRKKIHKMKDVNEISSKTDYEPTISLIVKAGLVEELKLIIELGADVNANSSEVPFSTRPLDYATSLGRLEMVRILLDSGAQVTGEQGWLPLAGAVENDSIEISNILVSAGASLTLPAPIGAEPLIQKAARANACRVLPLLLKAGHDINAYDEDNSVWPILATAILSNSQEFFLLALKLGADPNIAYQGKNVLAWAVHWKELRLTSPFWKGERDSADKFDFFIDELKNQ